MIRIFADENIPFLKGVLEPYAHIEYFPGKQITREILKHADALLIRTRTKCNPELLTGTPVQFIASATIGFDHIDTDFCEKQNIFWTNAPGCNSSSVQQYVAAAMLKISSRFRFSLKDKTIGIIGVGNVGAKVEKFARVMGMNVILCDPPRARKESDGNFTSLENLLKESDIVTIHVPLNDGGEDNTFHLFDEKTLSKIRQGSWLFNTSRGEVTDTDALRKIVSPEKNVGTVIDVWENEPNIDRGLMLKSFISTPHIAGYSTDGKVNGTAMVVNSLCKYFNLPLVNWYPVDVPEPSDAEINIDGEGKSDEAVIGEAVSHSYNIYEDDRKLRSSPADFEKQRGAYPLRREFSSYRINLTEGTEEVHRMLVNLGFKLSPGDTGDPLKKQL